jgi:iron only hydrogenase large subunit-like protein
MIQEEVTKILEELYKIREILGLDLTDIARETVDDSLKTQTHILKVRKDLSTLAGIISKLVIETEEKEDITENEKANLERIKEFGKKLGNMQFKLNKINKHYDSIIEVAEALGQDGINLGGDIIELQDDAREITGIFKSLGYQIPKSDIQTFLTVQP